MQEGRAAADVRQPQQHPNAHHQQHGRQQSEDNQPSPLAIEQKIAAEHPRRDDQADGPANPEAQHQQCKDQNLAARRREVVGGIAQVEHAERDGRQHQVEGNGAGLRDEGVGQQHQGDAQQRPTRGVRRQQAVHQGDDDRCGDGARQPRGQAGDLAERQ
ncbi:hypothetical protein D3C76_903560 [compost metagenome]